MQNEIAIKLGITFAKDFYMLKWLGISDKSQINSAENERTD
jgi:hypothetical protein